ncbi:olfactory receptor CB1 [Eucyclogobius newberryi]|uniref:olfactory receptor CB1 n=1 Tax=Eucyclogobius newberryi TaxID=166745 RepID=UPI003B5BAA72
MPVLWTLLVVGAWLPALVPGCAVMDCGGRYVCGARVDGDVMVGLMLPCHGSIDNLATRTRPEMYQCSDFDLVPFLRSLAEIHAIEEVNAAGVLPGIRLGYMMCDTCSHPSKALKNVELMLAYNHSQYTQCDYTDYRPAVKAILGARYSETSISVARLLSVYMIPLLSSTSSSPALSDKLRYPVFLRTVPSDVHQTKALTQLMAHFSWNWVGVVYRDDNYGKAALQSFLQDARRANVCVAYQEVLPFQFEPQNNAAEVQQVARQIRSSTAQVVLLILKPNQVEAIFKEMIRTNTKKIWIACDSWAVNGQLAQMEGINKVGDILGFMFIASKSESFDNYLRNLSAPLGGYNQFIEEYKNLRFNCSPECFQNNPPSYCPSPDLLKMKSPKACESGDPQTQNDDYIVRTLDTGEAFLERGAIWAVAHALKKVLQCNSSSCTGRTDFPPWKLLEELKRIRFEYEDQKFFFDENGDSLNGYDLVMWSEDDHRRKFSKIGRYSALDELIKIDQTQNLVWLSTRNSTVPICRCSKRRCPPGYVKKILNVSCCYSCVPCEEGSFTDGWDHENCKICPNETWCLKGKDRCVPRNESYLRWTNAHPIAIMAATGFGFLLLLVAMILFWIYRNCSAMKRAEVSISTVMIAGLSVSFASVICFMGKPNIHLCRARQVMYALGFTTCVSCILVKAYRTFLAFLPFGRVLHRRLNQLYQPAAIIIVLTVLQGVICCLWLIFDSPDIDSTAPSPLNLKKVIQCHEGTTYIGFGIMLSYIALLALVGFVLAFKGRKVPHQFSETGYIIFSMLMYLFVWVCFIPVYITNKEERTVVQASAIVVSNYGIIFCHFLPKCYEAIWGPDTDTMERFYNRMRAMAHCTSPIVNPVPVPHIDVPSEVTMAENTNTLTGNLSPAQTGGSLRHVNQRYHNSLRYRPPNIQGQLRLRSKSF